MKWRNDDMLLRIAQGDAFAAVVEYVDVRMHSKLVENALPEFLTRDLEDRGNLKYGPDYLLQVGCRLTDAYCGAN